MTNTLAAPVAKEIPHCVGEIDGVKVHDEYYWFRKREDPKVLKYLEEENAFAETMMADTSDLQDLLYEECVKRDALLQKPVMRQLDDFFYYSRPQQDQQYQVHCRRYEREDNEEQIILDENLEAEGCDYFCLGAFDVSQVLFTSYVSFLLLRSLLSLMSEVGS